MAEQSSLPAGIAAGALFEGRYQVEEVLGRGGMAVVLRARHVHLDQNVAIKVLLPDHAREPALVARFLREGRAATSIRDEHVCRVFDVSQSAAGLSYMVLELLVGEDLADVVEREGRLPVPVAVDYVLQACEALALAHALGIVHRDVKPANLFLTRTASGEPLIKVLDFGISKMGGPGEESVESLTASRAVLGSPSYMAPEQMRSARGVDARADVWSIGAVLFKLIAGRPPFEAESVPELYASVLHDDALRLAAVVPDTPPGLDEAVARCLVRDPGQRCPSVIELASAIAPFGTDAGRASATRIAAMTASSPASAPSGMPDPVMRARRGARPRAIVVLGGGTVLVAAVTALVLATRPPESRPALAQPAVTAPPSVPASFQPAAPTPSASESATAAPPSLPPPLPTRAPSAPRHTPTTTPDRHG